MAVGETHFEDRRRRTVWKPGRALAGEARCLVPRDGPLSAGLGTDDREAFRVRHHRHAWDLFRTFGRPGDEPGAIEEQRSLPAAGRGSRHDDSPATFCCIEENSFKVVARGNLCAVRVSTAAIVRPPPTTSMEPESATVLVRPFLMKVSVNPAARISLSSACVRVALTDAKANGVPDIELPIR